MSSGSSRLHFSLKSTLIRSLLLPVGLIFFITVFTVGYLWINVEYDHFAEDNQQFEQDYLENQKNILRSEVLRIKAQLLDARIQARQQLENSLKQRVNEAYDVAMGIYERHRGNANDAHIQDMIAAALSKIRVHNGRGYFFITSLDGTEQLYPANAKVEDLPANNRFTAIKQQIEDKIIHLASTSQEGLLDYQWDAPGHEDHNHQKFSYVKLFEPYGWVIGSSDYLNAVENEAKASVFKRIANIRHGHHDEGYFFVVSYSGDLYVSGGQYLGGRLNRWETTDANGTMIVQESASVAINKPDGGFVSYVWEKIGAANGAKADKIAFVIGMDEWQIYIGTGAYLDTIGNQVQQKSTRLEQQLMERIYSFLGILAVAILGLLLSVYLIARKHGKNISLFQTSFETAATSHEKIDTENIYFDEFKRLANSANQMIDRLNHQAQGLRHQVLHDDLTTLPNRTHGTGHLSLMIEQSIHHNAIAALMFIDLDHFKEINDSLGHSAGDELLKLASLRLQSVIYEDDIVARLGGDEFAIITGLLNSKNDAISIAERVMSELNKPFYIDGAERYITVSIGISLFPEDGNNADVLLRNADSAMYEAKKKGRNRYQFYNPLMTAEVNKRIEVVNDLRVAIEQQQFELHYQPQLDLNSGEIIGAEALVRWRHPEKGIIPPNEFIPYAESSGQIKQIGAWVLHEACSKMVQWQNSSHPIGKIAINVSNNQLRNTSLAKLVRQVLLDTGCDPTVIELEITESTLMKHPENVIPDLEELQHLGVSIAIDDFGTGYSSLSSLKQLPINKLKIDRSFVRDLDTDEDDRAIAKAIIAMGTSLNLTVIAEGVENESQADFLRNESCQQGQGYLYTRPIPEEELLSFLQQHKAKQILLG